jgi:hypothetical protein
MAGYRDRLGNYGFVMAILPWLLLMLTWRFLFIWGGDYGPGEDPRYVLVPVYLGVTGLVSLVGVVITIVRGKGAIGRAVLAVLAGVVYLLFALTLISMLADPNSHGFE